MTKLLRDLPVGSLVRDKESRIVKNNYEGDLIWRIVDKNYKLYPGKSVTLITDKIIANIEYNNSKPDYLTSNVRKWLGSETGFMSWLSNDLKEKLLITKLNDYNISEKVFLASCNEVLYAENVKLAYFTDNNKLIARNLNDKVESWFVRDTGYSGRQYLIDYRGERGMGGYATNYGTRPLCNVNENIKVSDTPDSKGVYDMVWNQPPSKPSSFTLPEKAISRSETEISWTKSTDPERDPISYRLERSLDGGSFVERYKGSFTRYKDIIEDKGHKAVVYRVTAIDSYGNQSESLTSASLPVSDNTIPVIETSSINLGKRTTAYSVAYKVVDPDSGQAWTVTESLDGKVLKTFTAKVGTSYTSKLSASEWQKVLNGKHILKIEVVDSDGGKSAKEISFEKAITKLDFMLDKTGVQGIDKMPERAILSMGASIPSGASIKIEITNNGLDEKPVWQDCTAQVLGNEKIFFSNKKKTATKWAVNVRVTGDKKTATDVLSVSVIGGFYD